MVYRAVAVSNNILMRAMRDGVQVTPLKLQKILYFVASVYGSTTKENLLDERFEAWKFGPVIRSVYYEFRDFGSGAITEYATDAGQAKIARENDDSALREALDIVWAATRAKTPSELVRITHLDGSAWSTAWDDGDDYLSQRAVRADTTYRQALAL